MASTPNQQAEPRAGVRLEAVSGPAQGRIFLLEEGKISIGREPANQIALLDPLVSRRHCVVRRAGPDVCIEDVNSQNSTFVNGVPVKERVLVHGDQVRVGNSVFVFHGFRGEPNTSKSLRLDDSATPSGLTLVLRKENAVYLQAGASLPSSARVVRDLNVLLNFSRTLSSVHDVAALQQKVLDAVFEVAPADRASILLLEEGSDKFSSILGRYRSSGPEQPIRASQTILNQVIRDNVAVVSNDVTEDETYRTANSLMLPRVRSVLAAPIEAQGRLAGVIYLDASSVGVNFDAGLLQLVLALGNIAGVALENICLAERMAERMRAEHRTAREMEIARQVQSKLLPQRAPELASLDYAGTCIQARAVGGDYYDFLELGLGRVGFVLADIAGKGISAALLMANLQAHLRSQSAILVQDLPRSLRFVNRMFYESTETETYATLFLGIYEDTTRRLWYANCGHNPPLLLRGGGVERLASTATVLGLFEEWKSVVAETQLVPGDILAICTDGIVEAMNANQEEFGEARLVRILQENRHLDATSLLDAVVTGVQQFAAGEQNDDLTLLVARAIPGT